MNIVDLIEKKKNHRELTEKEIKFFVDGVVNNTIADYSISSFLMAVYFAGMTENETYLLTKAMMSTPIDLSSIAGIKVDKHSTGGVSDSTTLIVVPVLASLGLKVAKLSGRGLSFTGGTIDKLESIQGINLEYTKKKFLEQVKKTGVCIASQSDEIAPCDKILYSIRDVTGTIDSIPLIASSIMSKKLSGGADVILLDVKYGTGAFIKTQDKASELAEMMVCIGNKFGKKCVAIISNMDEPLSENIGCNVEVEGIIEILRGDKKSLLYALSKKISVEILKVAQNMTDIEAETAFEDAIDSKKALKQFETIVANQGGSLESLYSLKPNRNYLIVQSTKSGYVESIDAEKVGLACLKLKGGREIIGDDIYHDSGLKYFLKVGDYVEVGQNICRLFCKDSSLFQDAEKLIEESYTTCKKSVVREALIQETISIVDDKITHNKEIRMADYCKMVEHSLLRQDITVDDIKKLCAEAVEFGFYSVVVQPSFVKDAKKFLKNTEVKVGTVVSFPFGEDLPKVKAYQTKMAIKQGADEIDMVMSISNAKMHKWDYILSEIDRVNHACGKNTPLKVILETSLLTDEEIIKVCKICSDLHVQFVKTSTGYFGEGANERVVKLMKESVFNDVQVKASGGIRTLTDIRKLVHAGATRIGTSNGAKIARGEE